MLPAAAKASQKDSRARLVGSTEEVPWVGRHNEGPTSFPLLLIRKIEHLVRVLRYLALSVPRRRV